MALLLQSLWGALSASRVSVALTVILFIYLVSNRYRYGISHIPGPFLASVTDIWRLVHVAKGGCQKVDLELHRKYGSLVRLAPNLISVSDPEEIPTLYGISSKFKKSTFYVPFQAKDAEGLVPDPFILTDKILHSRMKKNGGAAYAMSSILKMEAFADRETVKLLGAWDQQYARTGKVFEMSRWLSFYTLDTVVALTFGEDFGTLDTQEDRVGMLDTMEKITIYGALMGQVPFFHRFVDGNNFLQSLVFGKKFVQAFSGMIDLASSQVTALKVKLEAGDLDPKAPATFVERLLETQKRNPKSLTSRELDAHAMGNITAGGDTTSIALRSIMYHVLKNPEVKAELIAEIDAAGLSSPVSYEAASKLPYLQAVIRESMRVHPSVGFQLSRTVPKGGATICGRYIPEGTDVGVNPWIVHRDPELFPNPHKFEPERWLTTDEALLAQRNRAFLTFGNGPHTCSGRYISLMEINKLVPMLFMRYDIQLADPKAELIVRNYWFMFTGDIDIRITRREKSQEGLDTGRA